MGIPLEWTEISDTEFEASRGQRDYVVSKRPDGQWVVTLFSTFTGERDKLGDYKSQSEDDAKGIAQGLADQG